jgi:hypothetical protein
MTKLLFERGTPIPRTGALHTAAQNGYFNTMRVLMQYGADVNEVLYSWRSWTPMHFAASNGEVDALTLLKLLRVDATWAIRCSSSREDLSYGRNRWLVNRVRSAASHSNNNINFPTSTKAV